MNGTISYSYLLDPCTDPNITNKPSACASLSETTPCQAIVSTLSSYQCGVPYSFSQTRDQQGDQQRDPARRRSSYAEEDDWKVTPNFTWSYGLRLETQNYINSTHDFGPRTSLAWGVPRKSGKTTTVLRAGARHLLRTGSAWAPSDRTSSRAIPRQSVEQNLSLSRGRLHAHQYRGLHHRYRN